MSFGAAMAKFSMKMKIENNEEWKEDNVNANTIKITSDTKLEPAT
jgi:hypothetical protein